VKRLLTYLFGPSKADLIKLTAGSLDHLNEMKAEVTRIAHDVLAQVTKLKSELRESEKKRRQLEQELAAVNADWDKLNKAATRKMSEMN
jgi:septal ring factor EnvC (AmiA/AmiB activator)